MRRALVALFASVGLFLAWSALNGQTMTLVGGGAGEPEFSPAVVPPGLTAHFVATYTNTAAPVYVRVYVKAPGGAINQYPMLEKDTADLIYTDGKVYASDVALVATGGYSYWFEANDGVNTQATPETPGPVVNAPPVLSNGSVTPQQGPNSSPFTFEVTYQDAEGDLPGGAGVSVVVDGVSYPLSQGDTNPISTGRKYSAQLYPPAGLHTFYFTAVDSVSPSPVTFPAGGASAPLQGPVNGAKIEGTVKDSSTGQSVPNVKVETEFSTAGPTATTDAQGRYSLFVSEGSHTITASAQANDPLSNLQDKSVPVTVALGETKSGFDVALEPYGVVAGTVTSLNLDGSPGPAVGGATVRVTSLNDNVSLVTGTTNPDGTFSLARVPTGKVVLKVAGTVGLVQEEWRVVAVSPGTTTTQDVSLAQGATVTVDIQDSTGAPVSGGWVAFEGPYPAGPYHFYTSGTALARMSYTQLWAGTYHVTVTPPTNRPELKQRDLWATVAAGQTLPQTVTLTEGAVLQGKVLDPAGNPVDGASVNVTLQWGPTTSTSTANGGNYKLPGLAPGDYRVEVQPPLGSPATWLRAVREHVAVADNTTTTADVTLNEGGTIAGQITDGANPVLGAGIDISETNGAFLTHATSDTGTGNYSVALPAGNYRLVVTPPDGLKLARSLDWVLVTKGQTVTRNIALPAAASLSVSVKLSDGTTPVVGATVSVSPAGKSAPSDTQGVATVGSLDAGTYRVTITPPAGQGLVERVIEGVEVLAGQPASRAVTLDAAASLSGRVKDGANVGVDGATVTLSGAGYFSTITISGGYYSSGNLVPGRYQIEVTPPTGKALLPNSSSIVLPAGQPQSRDVILPVSAEVDGRVLDPAGNPLQYVSVYAVNRVTSSSQPSVASTQADGTFQLRGLPAGIYDVVADPPANATALPRTISSVTLGLTPVNVGDIQLGQACVLRGAVRDSGGQPVSGVTVSAYYLINHRQLLNSAVTRADGSYSFNRLPPGPVQVRVIPPDYGNLQGVSFAENVVFGQDTVHPDVVLAAGPTVSGGSIRVTVTCQGQPVLGAQVSIPYQEYGESTYSESVTDQFGVAILTGLIPGTYSVRVDPGPNVTNATSAFIAGVGVTSGQETPLAVALSQGGTVQGTVTDQLGKAVTDRSVELRSANGQGYWSASTMMDGMYRIDGLPAGTYDLLVTGSYLPSDQQAPRRIGGIIVATGQVVRQDVTLTPGGTLRIVTATIWKGQEQPVPGAMVWVEGTDYSGNLATSADSACAFPFLAPGSYHVRVTAPDGTNVLDAPGIDLMVTEGTSTERKILLPSGSALYGQVTDGTSPVAGATVVVEPEKSAAIATTTDAQGNYRVERIPGSPVTLVIQAPDQSNLAPFAVAQLPLTVGGETLFDKVLQKGGSLAGTVSFGGTAVQDAGVVLSDAAGNRVGSTQSDAQGSYRFVRLAPGTYRLRVSPPEERDLDAAYQILNVAIFAGQDATLDVPLAAQGSIDGNVREAGSGSAVAGGHVLLSAEGGVWSHSYPVDSDGHFRAGQLAAGLYRLACPDPSYPEEADALRQRGLLPASRENIRLDVGQKSATQDLLLPGGVGLTGTVLEPGGNPVAGAWVSVQAAAGPGSWAASDARGVYRIEGIPAGTYSLSIQAPSDRSLADYRRNNLALSAGVTTFDVTLSGQATISVRVLAGGTPVAGAHLTLQASELWSGVQFQADANAEGAAYFGKLPAGLFSIQVDPPDRQIGNLLSQRLAAIRLAPGQALALPDVNLAPAGSVAGQVTDQGRTGQPGVPVFALDESGEAGSTTTDAQGNYRIDGLRPGYYRLEARPSPDTGLQNGSMAGVRVSAGAAASCNLLVAPGCTISGHVLDPGGQPVAGAMVSFLPANGPGVQTGGDGSYTLKGLLPGSYTLNVSVMGDSDLLPTSVTGVVVAPGGSVAKEITLARGGTLTGVVHGLDGQPRANAWVRLLANREPMGFAMADGSGVYRVKPIQGGTYTLVAAGGYGESYAVAPTVIPNIAVAPGQTVTQDVSLAAPARLKVKVTGPDGSPLADASIAVSIADPSLFADAWQQVLADEGGGAVIDLVNSPMLGQFGVPSGLCKVTVQAPSGANLLPQTMVLATTAGQDTVQSFVLGKGAVLSGRVTDAANSGLAEADVTLVPRDNTLGRASATTDSTGAYSFIGLPPGLYDLLVDGGQRNPRFLSKQVRRVQLDPGTPQLQNVTLDKGALLAGTVTDAQSGNPVADATVLLQRQGAASDPEVTRSGMGDSGGQYLIVGLPAGRYQVQVRAPGYQNLALNTATVDLALGDEKQYSPKLSAGGAIEGVVKGQDGQAVPGVHVSLVGEALGDCETDINGQFRLTQLAAGTYDLSIQPPSTGNVFLPQEVKAIPVAAGATVTRSFILRQCGELRGMVKGSDGTPVVNARVSYGSPGAAPVEVPDAYVLTDSSGLYHIARVPTGPTRVWVKPPDGAGLLPGSVEGVEIVARQVAQADLVLLPAAGLRGVVKGPDGGGLPNVHVRLLPSERAAGMKLTVPAAQTTTDAVGLYVFPQLQPGRYDITADPSPELMADLVSQTVSNVQIAAGQTPSQDLTLPRGGAVAGTVKDAAGTPVTGSVSVIGVGTNELGAAQFGRFSIAVPIGPDGSYSAQGLPEGRYTVTAPAFAGSSATLLQQQAQVTITAGAPLTQNFTLVAGGSITGKVLAPDGSPAPASVSFWRVGAEPREREAVSVNGAGIYQIDRLAPGDYRVRVVVPAGLNWLPQEQGVTVQAGQPARVDFQLGASASLSGRVDDAAGQPLSGVRLELEIPGAGDTVSAETDVDGMYLFAGIPSGTFNLIAHPPTSSTAVGQVLRGVVVAPGTSTVLNVVLAAAAAIQGTVTDSAGTPLAGVRVQVMGAGVPALPGMLSGGKTTGETALIDTNAPGRLLNTTTTDASGKFSFTGLPAGHFTLVATPAANHGMAVAGTEVDVQAGQVAAPAIALPPAARLSGEVRDANNALLPGVTVQIAGRYVYSSTTTDEVGQYAFDNLAPDRYHLTVVAPHGEGSGSKTIDLEIAAGGQVTQPITLSATGTLRGTVTGPAGVVAGALVQISGAQCFDSRTTDGQGAFVFLNLASGAYKVTVTPPSGAPLNVLNDEVILAPAQDLAHDFSLVPSVGTVSGAVRFQGTQSAPVLVALFEAKPGTSAMAFGGSGSGGGSGGGGSTRSAKKITRGWAAIDQTAVGTERPAFQVSLPAPGAFTFTGVPDGQYHVLAVMDLNGNGQVDPGEPVGMYGQPNAIFVAGGASISGVSFALHLPTPGMDLGQSAVTPRNATPGASINVRVTATGADNVYAEVRDAATGASAARVPLLDDGQHGDGAAGDGEYGNTLQAPATPGDFYVDFEGVDAQGNRFIRGALAGFTTAPFAKTGSVLLISHGADGHFLQIDSQGNQGNVEISSAPLSGSVSVERCYTDILNAAGRPADVWRSVCRGPLDPATLMGYAAPGNMALLVAPYATNVGGPAITSDMMARFLEARGRLMISSQDMGRAIEADGDGASDHFDAVYREYLHAGLVGSGVSYALDGRPGDPLTDQLGFRISGGDGANNQWNPDVITALPPAQPLLSYRSDVAAMTRSTRPAQRGVAVLYPRPAAGHAPTRAFSQDDPEALPCAGLRLDNGRYKVVYLAFGLEAIADPAQRAALLNRSVAFLLKPLSTASTISASADQTTLPADGVSISTLTATVTDGGGAPVPDGTLVDFRAYNAQVAQASVGTLGGRASVLVTAGKHPGPMTVAVSSGAAAASVVLGGQAAQPGVVGARSIGPNAVEVTFDRAMDQASVQNAANYTIAPALAVSAAALSADPSRVILTTAAQAGIAFTVTVQGVTDPQGAALGARNSAGFIGSGPAPVVAITASRPVIVSDGADASALQASVTLPDGSAAPDGVVVNFGTLVGRLTPATATTVGGKASATLTSTSAGNAVVSATVGAAQASVPVTVVDAASLSVVVQCAPSVVPNSGSDTAAITATVTDGAGNLLNGLPVSFTASLGSITPGKAITANGIASATISSTQVGIATVTATTASGKTGSGTVEFAQRGAPRNVTVTPSVATLPADGQSIATLTIQVTDAFGTAVPDGTMVNLSTTLGSLLPIGQTTGGKFVLNFMAPTTAGSATITATAGDVNPVSGKTVILIGQTATLSGALTPDTLLADGKSTATLVVNVDDSWNQPVPDGTPFQVTASTGTVTPASGVTASGKFTVTYTAGTTPGAGTISATSGDGKKAFAFTLIDPKQVASLSIAADPTSLTADGKSTSRLTITALNPLNTPAVGATVQFSATSGTLDISSGVLSGQTLSALYTAGTTPGSVTVTATSGPVSQSVTLTLVMASLPPSLTLTSSANSLPADGMSRATLTVQVNDGAGHALPDGTAVTLSAGVGTLSATTGTTTGGKLTGITYTAPATPGSDTITASVGTASKSLTLTLTDQTTAYGTLPLPVGSTLPAGAAVELRDPADDSVVASSPVGSDGTFGVSGTPKIYDVVLRAVGSVPARVPGVNLTRAGGSAAQQVRLPVLPQPSFGTGMRMVTMPFLFRNGQVEKVVGDPDAVLWVYDPSLGRYRMTGTPDFPAAQPGQGFWMKQRRSDRGAPYQITQPAELPAQNQAVEVPLQNGWQLIGNPFATRSVDLSQLKIVPVGGGTPLDFRSAPADAPWRAHLWGWNGSGYELVSAAALGVSTTLSPYKAYWVLTKGDGLKLRFEPPATTLAQEPPARSRAAANGWSARLVARVGESVDTDNFFGAASSRLSIEGPPSMEGYVDVRFLTADSRSAAADIQEKKAGPMVWRFEVASDLKGQDATLTWPNLSRVPRNVRLVLVDEESGERRQMRTAASYTFRVGDASRQFRIEADASGTRVAAITAVDVVPVRSGGRSISYTLSDEGTASVSIVSPTGRVIKQVADTRAAHLGRNDLYWDGRDERGVTVASGVVLVKIRFTSAQGATVEAVRPAMIAR